MTFIREFNDTCDLPHAFDVSLRGIPFRVSAVKTPTWTWTCVEVARLSTRWRSRLLKRNTSSKREKRTKSGRGVYPNFGHTTLISSFIKCKFLQVKYFFVTIFNGPSVLKLFQCSYSIYKVHKPRMIKLG